MKSIFLISTAPQLLNAYEAKESFNIVDYEFVILRFEPIGHDIKLIEKVIETLKIENVTFFDLFSKSKRSTLKAYLYLIMELNKVCYDIVFIGFFSANFRRIVANLNYNKLFLIDDGIYTLGVYREIYRGGKGNYIRSYSEKRKKGIYKKLKFWFFHFIYRKGYFLIRGYRNDFRYKDRLNFFTIYDLQKCKFQEVVKNNFSFLKEKFNYITNAPSSSGLVVYFLGQPLHRFGMDNTFAVDLLGNLFNRLLSKFPRIIYIPHRAEKSEIFEAARLENEEKIEVLKLDIPVELYVLEENIMMSHLVSFISSALFSLKTINCYTNIMVLRIPEVVSKLSNYDKENISYIQKKLKNQCEASFFDL